MYQTSSYVSLVVLLLVILPWRLNSFIQPPNTNIFFRPNPNSQIPKDQQIVSDNQGTSFSIPSIPSLPNIPNIPEFFQSTAKENYEELFKNYNIPYKSATRGSVGSSNRAVYFTGAGIYFWWQLGVAKYLNENIDRNDLLSVPVLGASAGSITSSLLLSNGDLEKGPKIAERLVKEFDLYNRPSGLGGVWGQLLNLWLEEMIPTNLDENIQDLKNLHISLTSPMNFHKLVTNFTSREELLSAIQASCHIPFFLNGKPFTEYKGEKVIDGSFWYFMTNNRVLGLPRLNDLPVESIYYIDYSDDEIFMSTINGNFMKLITIEEMYDMIDAGYNYMKREHQYGRLPLESKPLLNYVTDKILSKAKKDIQLTISEVNGNMKLPLPRLPSIRARISLN